MFGRLSVIRSWRAAAVAQDQCAGAAAMRMPPLWVVFAIGYGCCDEFRLLSAPTMQSFLWNPPGSARIRCVSSSGGWLAGTYMDADRMIRISLLNPLTNARIDVSPAVRRVITHTRMCESRRCELEEIELCRSVHKVAFSPNPTEQDFAVAVAMTLIPSCNPAVAFPRAGCDGRCAVVDLGPDGRCTKNKLDVAYHQSKFYYMTSQDLQRCPPPRRFASGRQPDCPATFGAQQFAPTVPRSIYDHHHLAFTGDGALYVVCSTDRERNSSGVDMVVLWYDPSRAEHGSSPWAEATCLRGHAFLLSDLNQTLSVGAAGDDGAWLRPDSMCFTNIRFCSILKASSTPPEGRGAWVFHLPTGDIRQPTQHSKDDCAGGGHVSPEWTQHQPLSTPTPAPDIGFTAPAPPPLPRDGIRPTPDAPPTGAPLERLGTVVASPSTAVPPSLTGAEPRRGSTPAHGPYWCPEHGWTAERHVLLPDTGDDGGDHVFTPRPGGTMAARTGAPRLYDHPPIPVEGRPVEDSAVAAPGVGFLINPGSTRAARRGLPPYYVNAEEAGLLTPTPASPEPAALPPPSPRLFNLMMWSNTNAVGTGMICSVLNLNLPPV
ncbi:hypothetical protein BS78_03G084100 [Paspalum vaginatum]|nr:hypothetical protein BS78_03G084100 [Paspalum vaginatum]